MLYINSYSTVLHLRLVDNDEKLQILTSNKIIHTAGKWRNNKTKDGYLQGDK